MRHVCFVLLTSTLLKISTSFIATLWTLNGVWCFWFCWNVVFSMLHLVENGIMYRLRKYWDARKPMCIESAKKFTFHVGLKEFSSGLIVLSFGVCYSLFLLMIEVIICKKECILDLFRKKNVVKPFTNWIMTLCTLEKIVNYCLLCTNFRNKWWEFFCVLYYIFMLKITHFCYHLINF